MYYSQADIVTTLRFHCVRSVSAALRPHSLLMSRHNLCDRGRWGPDVRRFSPSVPLAGEVLVDPRNNGTRAAFHLHRLAAVLHTQWWSRLERLALRVEQS